MPLDPSIILGLRPAQIQPPQIQTPLERYGRLLSLRGLVEQQQLRQAQFEQTELENRALRRKAQQEADILGLYAGGAEPTEQQLLQKGGLSALPFIKQRAEAKKEQVNLSKAQIELLQSQREDLAHRMQRVLSAPPDRQAAVWTEERNALEAARPGSTKDIPIDYPGLTYVQGRQKEGLAFDQFLKDQREQWQLGRERAAMILAAVPPERRADVLAALSTDDQEHFKGVDLKSNTAIRKAVLPPEKAAQIDQQQRTAASQIRQDWLNIAKPFQMTVDSYQNIQAVRGMDAPVRDSILVRQLMKLLEPTSAVLGAEQQDIQMRAGLWDWLGNLMKNIETGHRLTDAQRKQILDAADNIFTYRQKLYAARGEDYQNIARGQDIDPDWVVNKFDKDLMVGPPPKTTVTGKSLYGLPQEQPAPTNTPAAAPTGGVQNPGDVEDGWVWLGGDRGDRKNWRKEEALTVYDLPRTGSYRR